MKRWTIVITAVFFILCAGTANSIDTMPRVKLTTSKGEIVLALNPAAAPKTVENFLQYVKDGFYDGTIFHRVIAQFMIQGGGFDDQMRQKPTRSHIQNEADNGLKNRIGTIAMARTSDPHSATAQFFINVKTNDFLNHQSKSSKGWGYCVFGKVVSGMNIVRAIENVPTTSRSGMRDVPEVPVVIQKAEILPVQ